MCISGSLIAPQYHERMRKQMNVFFDTTTMRCALSQMHKCNLDSGTHMICSDHAQIKSTPKLIQTQTAPKLDISQLLYKNNYVMQRKWTGPHVGPGRPKPWASWCLNSEIYFMQNNTTKRKGKLARVQPYSILAIICTCLSQTRVHN